MSRRLVLSPRAVLDLEEIASYIARESSVRAVTFIGELEAQCTTLALAPLSYPAREDLASGMRMAVHGRYLVLFRDMPDDGLVRIERVLQGARNLRTLV